MPSQVLNIGPGSDGDGRKWPKHHYERNDDYYLDRVAAEWIKDLPGGPQPGVTYRLNRLPMGYAGFQRARPDSKHVDRYIYGHPNGQFRSMIEFYPHFKHLMEVGGSAGCTCIKCAGNGRKPKGSIERRSNYFAQSDSGSGQVTSGHFISPTRPAGTFKMGRYSSDDEPPKRRDIDAEGTPDVYERLIQRLKDAGPDAEIDEKLEERTSPDWRASHKSVVDVLKTTRKLPRYAPRIGEIVLFLRKLEENELLAWDHSSNTFRRIDTTSNTWREAPRWEAGIVTQMPQEDIIEKDLQMDQHKTQSIIYSGFRVEPLSEPGNETKLYTRQTKHVPLHAVRPLTLWQECLRGTPESDWHATIKHALTVTSSLCMISRYRFKGTWPNASVFCRGMYLGPELILVGDVVRLLPRSGEQRGDAVTEIMVITAIRLRFLNLDFDEDDLAPTAPALPYQTAVHVSGKVFTTDPSRSLNGVSDKPLDSNANQLPAGLTAYGPWYHYSDPNMLQAYSEVPFSRIMGRCPEHSAMKTLFTTPADVKTEIQPPAFKAVNAPSAAFDLASSEVTLLSRGLAAIKDARRFSQGHDARLTTTGQPWFWADTRIEQIDLHEVGGRFVGAKDPMRTKEQLSRWRKALKGLDGKKGAWEEYEAVRKNKLQEEKAALQGKGGMLGSAAVDTEIESVVNGDSAETSDDTGDDGAASDGDVMEVDELEDEGAPGPASASAEKEVNRAALVPPRGVTIDLMDSENEDELVQNQLVGKLSKNIRPGALR